MDHALRTGSGEGLRFGNALLISFLAHIFCSILLVGVAWLAKRRAPPVPTFELVNLEPPKLRPMRPKTLPPPKPVPPPPEPVKAPEAPKLTPKPAKPQPKRPEPKRVAPKEDSDKVAKVSERAPPPDNSQPNIQLANTLDPRLSLWASRVKKKAEQLWNPPTGIDISGTVQVVIRFKVNRDGAVVDPAVQQASSNSDLDQLALRTIQRLDHVPPIPENFPGDEVEVSYEFIYQGQ